MSEAVEPSPPFIAAAEQQRAGALDFLALFKPRITFFQVFMTVGGLLLAPCR